MVGQVLAKTHPGADKPVSILPIWSANLGETFGEDLPLATGVPARQRPRCNRRITGMPLDRKVFQRTPIPPMRFSSLKCFWIQLLAASRTIVSSHARGLLGGMGKTFE
jgi:hypothetical protein